MNDAATTPARRTPGDAAALAMAAATAAPPGAVRQVFRRLRGFGLLAFLVAGWQFLSVSVLDDMARTLLPPPTAIVAAAWELLVSGELWRHTLDSLKREMVAFVWALAAVPLGIAVGWWRGVEEQVDPIIELLRPVPPLAWIPLSILWFGVGDTQNQFIIFLGIFFPILLNTITGVRGVERNLVRAARSLGAGECSILWRIVLRAALPQIVTGIRVGLGVGWMALVAAELVGASSGLGFLINDARTILRTDFIIVGMISIGVIGLLLDRSIRIAASRLLPWSRGAGR